MYTSMFRKAMLGDTATLNLDFTTGVLDSRLTFTRAAGTATYINSSGYVTTAAANTPRFDYDPVTLAPRGLLIEGSATNLLNWSESFADSGGAVNWNWSSLNVTRGTVTTTNPTGSSATVIKVEETTDNGIHATLSVPSATASTTYTLSVWAKAAERTFVQLVENGGSGANSMVNLSTGAIVSESTAGITTVTALGTTGWYRIAMRLTTAVGQTSANCQFRLSTNGTTTSYAGTTGSGIYIWGAQLEAGSGASSYIPTGASQVTRNGDSCVMTGTNFSSWFAGATEGVLFAQYEKPRSQSGNATHDFSAVGSRYTSGAGFIVYASNLNYYPTVILWTTVAAVFGGGITTAIPSVTKQAAKWFGGNDVTNYSNGVVGTTGAGTGTVTPAMLSFGANSATGTEATRDWLNACIRQVKFYPTALSDAAIQTLTTT